MRAQGEKLLDLDLKPIALAWVLSFDLQRSRLKSGLVEGVL
jgi:hypothetical protein